MMRRVAVTIAIGLVAGAATAMRVASPSPERRCLVEVVPWATCTGPNYPHGWGPQ